MAGEGKLDPEVRAEIDLIAVDRERPMVIADADEVLLVFMAAFEAFLQARGHYFDWSGYRLNGNIRNSGDGRALAREAVGALLDDFYAQRAGDLAVVPDAAACLSALSARAQVIVMTNVPPTHGPARKRSLARQGMGYPMIVNRGPKGPAVAALADGLGAPVFFIDDSPAHLASVADHAGHVRRVQFIHDRRLARLVAPAPACHHRIDDWPRARALIEAELAAAGF